MLGDDQVSIIVSMCSSLGRHKMVYYLNPKGVFGYGNYLGNRLRGIYGVRYIFLQSAAFCPLTTTSRNRLLIYSYPKTAAPSRKTRSCFVINSHKFSLFPSNQMREKRKAYPAALVGHNPAA